MCKGATVLIVEDEAIIALDLTMTVECAGGSVVGPAATTAEALVLIAEGMALRQPITAAILDGNLADGNVAPVVWCLHQCGVPMVVYSAVGLPGEVASLAGEISVILKPHPIFDVVATLTSKLAAVVRAFEADGSA